MSNYKGNRTNTINNIQSFLVEPESIIKTGNDHYFIDFGKDAFGTLVLSIKSSRKDTLIIHLGEKAVNSIKVDTDPGGTIRYQRILLPIFPSTSDYTIKLPRDSSNTTPPAVELPDSFGVIMPFRYCELENLKIPISDLTIKQKVYNYHFNDTASSFICSDTILNHVWELCKYSIKATSFCGIYIDGDRERIPYEADALINQLSHYCVDNDYSMARRTCEYFISNPTWPTEWILHTVLLFYYDYLYTGNIESIKKNYEALKVKTLIDLERSDGLISSKSEKLTDELMKKLGFKDFKQRIIDIVDWPSAQFEESSKSETPLGERDGYDMVEINTVVNSFYYMNLKLMVEIAGYLGKKEDSVFFQRKSIIVKNVINQKLFDKSKGIYIDGENSKHSSLHANMFPLAFGIVSSENMHSVVSFIKTRGMSCSVYGAQYLLEGLFKTNEADYALKLMTSTNDRSWWNMIRSGSTITTEAWDIKYKKNMDWNHPWGSAPANIITRYLCGITPVHPGFKKVQIRPQLSNLTFSKIKVPTTKGSINAEYKKINDKYKKITIEIPSGMNAVFVPDDNNSEIFLNYKKLKSNGFSVQLKEGTNLIELKN